DGGEPEHSLAHVGAQEQMVHHVEHEQRAHPVVGEALPHLGEEQEEEAARVPEPGFRFGGRACRLDGGGHLCSSSRAVRDPGGAVAFILYHSRDAGYAPVPASMASASTVA